MKRNKYSRFRKALPFMQSGGTIQPMIPRYTSQLNLPQSSVNISKVPNVASQPGSMTGWGMGDSSGSGGTGIGTASGIAGGVSTIFNALAAGNQQNNPYSANLAGQSTGQQVVDSLVSQIPVVGQIYGAGKVIGDYAKTDYGALDEYGQLADTGKYTTADTIGMFIDPLGSFISGLSGEGWTPQQRADITNTKGAKTKQQVEVERAKQWRATNQAENPGRFYDTNQMMMAAYGGPLEQPVQNMQQLDQQRGQLSQNMQQPNQMPQVTEYNTGGTHEQNPNQGVPIDSEGNPATVSGGRAVALTEAGEVAFKTRSGETYIFSSKVFI